MKTHIPILFILFIPLVAVTQISITTTDMPVANTIYKYNWANEFTTVDPELTGPAYTWNFSYFTASSQDADTFLSVSSTPFAYQFYFNNIILYPDWKASYALKGQDFQLGNIGVNNVMNYFKNDPSDYKNVGFGATINSIPISVRNNPIDYIYRFPMNYGDSDSSISKFGFNVPSIGYFGASQKRVNIVDGWGTLILPNDTFEVLRIKSIIQTDDTIYIDSVSFGMTIPQPTKMEYKWLANGQGVPVAQVNANLIFNNVVVNSARYCDLNSTGIDQHKNGMGNVVIYPNPSGDILKIVFEAGSFDFMGRYLEVCDITGNSLFSKKITGKTEQLSVEQLSNGIYFLHIAGDSQEKILGKFTVFK